MPFNIIRNDITKVRADAIVNTANPEPCYGSGTDCAIYKAAGEEQLLEERRRIGEIKVGEVAVTRAFALPAKYIIHTVGPIWEDGAHGEYEALASCYRKSLLIARQLGCDSIAFPLISAGNYGFPKDKALAIALDEIGAFLKKSDMDVTLVVFDRGAFELSSGLTESVRQFIDEKYVSAQKKYEYEQAMPTADRRRAYGEPLYQARREERSDKADASLEVSYNMSVGSLPKEKERKGGLLGRKQNTPLPGAAKQSAPMPGAGKQTPSQHASLDDILKQMSETFQERLLRMIDERDLADADVYKKANLDRKLFSKIRCNRDYTPKKKTALALAVALELNTDQTLDLLRRAGLTLSPSSKADLIVEYCLEHRIYDIYQINALLFEYDQPMLGS